jgi:hypothetical protein
VVQLWLCFGSASFDAFVLIAQCPQVGLETGRYVLALELFAILINKYT